MSPDAATLQLPAPSAPPVDGAALLAGTDWAGAVPGLGSTPCQEIPALKRALDVVGAVVFLLLAFPLLLVAAALIKLADGGPVLFRQQRVGEGGRPFQILKLRTMTVGAESLAAVLVAADCTDGLLFRVPSDPRLTPVGRLLRRTAVDELPQLWNVLRGEMSLVGPRPLAVATTAFAPHEHLRHSVKPGLTGAWQVAGGNDLPWRDMIALDLDYARQWSLRRDLVILVRTVPALVSRVGPS